MNLLKWLNKQVRPEALGIFRIVFGVIMFWDLLRIVNINLIDSFYHHGIIFSYDFLPLPLPSVGALKFQIFLLMICSVLIALGKYYRIAMTVFAFGFTYFFFLDQVLYNNHLYLICLLSFMMIFMPADAALSLSKKQKRATIPQWSYRLLQFQLIVVYFFGGIVKLNPYWLDFHPVEELMHAASNRLGAQFLEAEWIRSFFTYGGIVFDVLIGPMLLWKKTRKISIIAAIFFNTINSIIFDDIFIFPFFMMLSLILFIDKDWVYEKLKSWKVVKENAELPKASLMKKSGMIILMIYVLFQVSIPLRHYFIPGYTDWTGEGQRFSWRMKIQNRSIEEMSFAVFDLDTKVIHPVNVEDHLFPDEIYQMANSPQMILQFANYLHDSIAPRNHIHNCWVKSKVKVVFNGRPATYIFDPELDLIEASHSGKPVRDFIEPEPGNKAN